MRANSEKNSSFDISLFLKRFESLRESVVYFSAYKRFNHRQKETEIEKKKIVNARLGVYLTEDIRPNGLKS